MPRWETVAIVGVGAIGGSIGAALRQRGLAGAVVGATRTPASAEAALETGAVDRIAESMEEAASAAQVVVVCTPVADIAEHVRRCAAAAPADALLTDGGSTKARLCRELQQLPRGVFVGSHPLAGTHRQGPRAARADLLEGRQVLLTPVAGVTPPQAVRQAAEFWESLGAHVRELSPEAHDQLLAYSSHCPHLVASALAAATPDGPRQLAASGWKDTTRVAQGSPALWEQIVRDNRDHILKALDDFAKTLTSIREALATDDVQRLTDLLELGKRNRDALGN